MADLAVDVALVAMQLCIPKNYSRDMARITGRTMPPGFSSVHMSGSQTHSSVHRREPGLTLSGGAFDQIISAQTELIKSVGRRVDNYIQGSDDLRNLERAWCDAAYWFHEGMAEPRTTIAVAKLETAVEVLLCAESSAGSTRRLQDAVEAFYGLKPSDALLTDPSMTVNQFVKEIVGARSRVLHGTFSTLAENVELVRSNVEMLSFDLLRLCSLSLDRYKALASPHDNAKDFLAWINTQRQVGLASRPS